MIRKKSRTTSLLAAAVGLSLGMYQLKALAIDYTFTGTGNWYNNPNNPNWSPNPNSAAPFDEQFFNVAGRNAIVNGAANYNPGGDFRLGNGNSLLVDGSSASWTQAAGTGAWVRIGAANAGATSTVTLRNGGTINYQAGGRYIVGDASTATLTVESTGGGFNVVGDVYVGVGSSVNLQGGSNSLQAINNQGTVNFSGGSSSTGSFNNQAGIYNVSGGTTTATNYDMNTAGAALNVSAGSIGFTNLTSNRALTITGGAVTVGNTFNTNSTSSVNISGGSLTKSGASNVFLDPSSTFLLSGSGAFSLTGSAEFQPGANSGNQSISGNASLNIAGLVAFQGGDARKFSVNGGSITIGSGGNPYHGIFSSGGYFNFTLNSSGSILFTNDGSGEINIFEGQIRYNDLTFANFALADAVFDISHPTTYSTLIKLDNLTPIPEPSTWAGTAVILAAFGWFQRRRVRDFFARLRLA